MIPAPCGSGKKYKRCCLAKSEAAAPMGPDAILPAAIRRAFAGGHTEEAAITAAVEGAAVMDQAVDVGWHQTDQRPACTRGCKYCCSVRVSVSVPEVALAVAYARDTLEPDVLERIEARARDNAPRTHGTPALGYPAVDCALLGEDGACLVYGGRPLACRGEQSLDVGDCKAAYEHSLEHPGEDYPVMRAPGVMMLTRLTWEAYQQALAGVAVDATTYELQEALHIALSEPDALARWLRGEPAFERAKQNTAHDADGFVFPQLVELRTKP